MTCHKIFGPGSQLDRVHLQLLQTDRGSIHSCCEWTGAAVDGLGPFAAAVIGPGPFTAKIYGPGPGTADVHGPGPFTATANGPPSSDCRRSEETGSFQ